MVSKQQLFRLIIVAQAVLLILLLAGCVSTSGKMRWAEQLYKNGQYLAAKGKEEAAVKKFQKSLKLSREIDFSPGIAHNLNELAIYFTARKNYPEARAMLTEAISLYRQEEMKPEVSKAMNNLAITYLREGRIDKTLEQYNELLDWDRQTGNLLGEAITLYNMGSIYERFIGNKKKAYERYGVALEYFKELGNEEYVTTVERALKSLQYY